MPKLLSRSKHKEFKSNSALQIRDQKERREKSEEKWSTAGILQGCENFATCRISQVANFRYLQNSFPAATVHPPGHCSLSCDMLLFDLCCSVFCFLQN